MSTLIPIQTATNKKRGRTSESSSKKIREAANLAVDELTDAADLAGIGCAINQLKYVCLLFFLKI